MTEMNEIDPLFKKCSTEVMYKIDSEENFYESGEDEPEKPEEEEQIEEIYREYELEELDKDELRKMFSEDEIDIKYLEGIHNEYDLRDIRKNYIGENYEEDGSKKMGKNYLREISKEDELEHLDTDCLEEINDEDDLEQLSEDSFEETNIEDDLELDTENLEESTKEDTLKLAKIDLEKINHCKLVKIKRVLDKLKENPDMMNANRFFLDKLSSNRSTSEAAVFMQGSRMKELEKTECAQREKILLHNRKKVRSSDKISRQHIKNTLHNAFSGEITKLKNLSRDLFEMKEDAESRNLLGKLSYLERSLHQSRESLEWTPLQQVDKPLWFNKYIESLFEARRKIQHYEQMLGRNVLARLLTDFSEVAKILEQPK